MKSHLLKLPNKRYTRNLLYLSARYVPGPVQVKGVTMVNTMNGGYAFIETLMQQPLESRCNTV